MPYIDQELRDKLESAINQAISVIVNESDEMSYEGMLNYAFTRIILGTLPYPEERYRFYNGAIGALECAKLELYRQQIAPYEDVKKRENGRIHPPVVPQPKDEPPVVMPGIAMQNRLVYGSHQERSGQMRYFMR